LLVGGHEQLFLALTVDDGDVLLPEAEKLLVVLGKHTIPLVMAVDQELSEFLNAGGGTTRGLDRVLKSVRVNGEIREICLLIPCSILLIRLRALSGACLATR
jgi:hypothetical protein